ncbi:E2F-associated phospho protein-domain-containing protein [Absidia repens]|uniref:E2F-associated phospho protein-domain-containing protein n=1 Tax=Absidia repens TaxID=90262 RepID=A0A1X2IGK6_9FUNG|nr:E2F-associated phospho protein-domain-containing protein [Absidia repens]
MNQQDKYYDTVYFDSDEDENNDQDTKDPSGPQGRQERLTNDHLLYDPLGDEKDEAWIAEQINKAAPRGSQPKDSVARTDAILSCPMCFSPLCFSCQRHENYSNQFRAMFVTNCQVNKKERYRYAATPSSASSRKKTALMDETATTPDQDEAYYVVKCETCDTHVAMMDEDEVYHFFNVIAN